MAPHDSHVIAVAADHPTETPGRPAFDLDDADGIAAFIAARAR
jgi:molybdopterin-guanine dinucleotide biosynthesis protein B